MSAAMDGVGDRAMAWARSCWAVDSTLSTEAVGALARGYIEGAAREAPKVARVEVVLAELGASLPLDEQRTDGERAVGWVVDQLRIVLDGAPE